MREGRDVVCGMCVQCHTIQRVVRVETFLCAKVAIYRNLKM